MNKYNSILSHVWLKGKYILPLPSKWINIQFNPLMFQYAPTSLTTRIHISKQIQFNDVIEQTRRYHTREENKLVLLGIHELIFLVQPRAALWYVNTVKVWLFWDGCRPSSPWQWPGRGAIGCWRSTAWVCFLGSYICPRGFLYYTELIRCLGGNHCLPPSWIYPAKEKASMIKFWWT